MICNNYLFLFFFSLKLVCTKPNTEEKRRQVLFVLILLTLLGRTLLTRFCLYTAEKKRCAAAHKSFDKV